jgi:hypothetical protein
MQSVVSNIIVSSIVGHAYPVTYNAAYYGYTAATMTYGLISYVVPAQILASTTAILVLPTTAYYTYKVYNTIKQFNILDLVY